VNGSPFSIFFCVPRRCRAVRRYFLCRGCLPGCAALFFYAAPLPHIFFRRSNRASLACFNLVGAEKPAVLQAGFALFVR